MVYRIHFDASHSHVLYRVYSNEGMDKFCLFKLSPPGGMGMREDTGLLGVIDECYGSW